MMRPEKVLSLTVIEPILMPLLMQTGERALFAEYDSVASGFIAAAARGEPEVGWKKFLDYRNGEGAWERLSEAAQARFLAITDNTVAGYKSNLRNPTTMQNLRDIGVAQVLRLCIEQSVKRVAMLLLQFARHKNRLKR